MTKSSDTQRPVGPKVDPLPPGFLPDGRKLHGHWVELEQLNLEKHGKSLQMAVSAMKASDWDYMAYGPFPTADTISKYLQSRVEATDQWTYVFCNRLTGEAGGVGSYMRADKPNGSIEIGHIWLSNGFQRSREGTESIYLLMKHTFEDLGMRRLEWKCDALNTPSRAAALRFGFTFEGIFRQHMVIKGRNRDTAWFAIIDKDWPAIARAFKSWLSPDNFDASGNQISKLQAR